MQKKTIICLICLMLSVFISLFTTGCLNINYDNSNKTENYNIETTENISFVKVETFEEGFEILMKIDKKHKASFKKEILGGPLIKPENIEPMRQDLLLFFETMGADNGTIEELKFKSGRTETDKLILLIDARLEMLKSEEEFQLGYKYGNAGLVDDGFYCTEKELILESSQHFENAANHGMNAWNRLDLILSGAKQKIIDLIGINDEKPDFYNSPLKKILKQVGNNRKIISENCPTGKENKYVMVEQK